MGSPVSILDAYTLGMSVFPAAGKEPLMEWTSYQSVRADRAKVEAWARGPKTSEGYCIATGVLSGVVVVDTDDDEAEAWALTNLPSTPWMCRTRKGVHRYYRWPDGADPADLRNRTGTHLVDGRRLSMDIRAEGGYVIGPGSAHPKGGQYQAAGDWSRDLADLPKYDPVEWWGLHEGRRPASTPQPARPAPAPQPAPTGAPRGRRLSLHDRAGRWLAKRDPAIELQGGDTHTYITAGRLRDLFGQGRSEIETLMSRWNQTCIPPWPATGRKSLAEKIDNAMKAPPGVFLQPGEAPEEEWAYSDEWQSPSHDEPFEFGRPEAGGRPENGPGKAQAAEGDGWDEDPLPLEAWDVPPAPRGLFPPSLEAYTDAVSACNQTPRDNPQAVALGIIAGVAQTSYFVTIDGRREELSMAVCVGADSAERKSADMALMRAPINEFEAEAEEIYRLDVTAREAEVSVLEAKRENIKKRIVKSGDDDLMTEMKELVTKLAKHGAVKQRRISCMDTTPERLSGLMAEQGSMLLMSAEGGPIEAMAGKYSGRRELSCSYMQFYSGEDATVDRQTGSYTVRRPALTMLLMSQPCHLIGILSDPLFAGRGLLERFMWVIALSMAGYRDIGAARPVPDHLAIAYRDTLRRLMPSPEPLTGRPPEREALKIVGEGQAAILDLARWLEPQYRPDGDLHHVRAWANRLPTLAAKVGALWHLWEAARQGNVGPGPVDSQWVIKAVQWVREYVLPMGLRVWGMLRCHPSTEEAKKVLAVLGKDPDATWTARDIQRAKRTMSAEQIDSALSLLETRGWIRREKHTTSKGGRPTERISLNPIFKSEPLGQNGQKGQNLSQGVISDPPDGVLSVLSQLSQGSTFENSSNLEESQQPPQVTPPVGFDDEDEGEEILDLGLESEDEVLQAFDEEWIG